jgi:quercetin dioxygenase-like cupin family protein
MTAELRDLLPEYLLGALSPEDAQAVARQLADSPELRAEADQLGLALAQVPSSLVPVMPSAASRARLMAAVDTSQRFSPFVDTLSRLLDMAADSIRQLLARVDDPASWEPGLPGMLYQHFTPGPRLVGVDAGLIRLEPGTSFPRHRHLAGNEITFVLEGQMIDGEPMDGVRYGPGSVVTHDQDTVHGYAATADRPLTIIVVNHGIQPVFG